jgi:hypothetical protein
MFVIVFTPANGPIEIVGPFESKEEALDHLDMLDVSEGYDTEVIQADPPYEDK